MAHLCLTPLGTSDRKSNRISRKDVSWTTGNEYPVDGKVRYLFTIVVLRIDAKGGFKNMVYLQYHNLTIQY